MLKKSATKDLVIWVLLGSSMFIIAFVLGQTLMAKGYKSKVRE